VASVLIVDDECLLTKCLRKYLSVSGYDAAIAASFAEALQSFDAAVPEVLVTDVGLPDGQAAELIDRFLELHSSGHVIVISGHDELPESVSVRTVDAVLLKPFDPEALVEAIRQTLDGPPVG
jgi:DNA-binding response OmpR family regulator